MAFGFEFAATIVAAVIGGYWIDGKLGTTPLFMLLFIVSGMTGAVYRLIWSLKKFGDVKTDVTSDEPKP